MKINEYGRQLDPAAIEAGEHRTFVGGLWDEMGALQFDFLKAQGLQPGQRLVDVGCGALRGGVHFIRYLEPGRYYGIDINASLIDAGTRELAQLKLEGRAPHLLVNERFELFRFATHFDCAIATSVFTHLPLNHILRCMVEVRRVLQPGARFFATFFEAPTSAHLDALPHSPGGIVTYLDADPYHYSADEIRWVAGNAGLAAERIGDWGHPRDQRMWSFRDTLHAQ
jgi:ubiquinone/menaquinone biosynthesis C-methylase UbiE